MWKKVGKRSIVLNVVENVECEKGVEEAMKTENRGMKRNKKEYIVI